MARLLVVWLSALATAADSQQMGNLDRTLVVMEAEFQQLYLLGPGERFRMLGRVGPPSLVSIELAPNGELYSIAPSTNELFHVNLFTAEARLIGAIGHTSLGHLAIASDGSAWTHDGSQIVSLDLATGAAQSVEGIGPLNFLSMAARAPDELVGLSSRGGANNHLAELGPNIGYRTLAPVIGFVGRDGGMVIQDGVGYFATGGMLGGGGHKLWRFDPFTGEQWLLGSLPARFQMHGTLGLAVLPDRKRARPGAPPQPRVGR